MPTYQRAKKDVVAIVTRMMAKYHPELTDAGVTVDVLMAAAKLDADGDPVGPAVKAHGYPAGAVARITSVKERAAGRADTEIIVDADRWPDLASEQWNALLDHELTHFELRVNDKGQVERDDLDRPKLRMRKHDHQFGWFDAVVRRHGRDSIEWSQFDAFYEHAYKQLWLPGMAEVEKVA
jgi:acetolactate synthase regulatory subunit